MCFSWGKMWQNCIMKILSPKIYILQLRANLVLQYSQEEGPQLPCWSSTRPGTRRTSAPEETTPDTRAFATLLWDSHPYQPSHLDRSSTYLPFWLFSLILSSSNMMMFILIAMIFSVGQGVKGRSSGPHKPKLEQEESSWWDHHRKRYLRVLLKWWHQWWWQRWQYKNEQLFCRHLKNTVKAPFVGKNSKKFPDGIEVVFLHIYIFSSVRRSSNRYTFVRPPFLDPLDLLSLGIQPLRVF